MEAAKLSVGRNEEDVIQIAMKQGETGTSICIPDHVARWLCSELTRLIAAKEDEKAKKEMEATEATQEMLQQFQENVDLKPEDML